MLKNININSFVKEKELSILFKKLYPICSSITGKGFNDRLKIINNLVKLNIKKVKSGTKVLDWIVPNVWNIEDGYLLKGKKKIIDFKKHSLHVINYSSPINKTLSFQELDSHLYTLPKIPNAIPYVHTYYDRNWGFALKHSEYMKMSRKTKYKAVIKSKIKPGYLYYSDNLIKGKSKKEILIYAYLCHPQLANHEISGPLLWTYLFKILKETGPHNYSYRFVLCPENIGAATFLHFNKKKVKNIKAGYIVNCVGNGNIVTLKKSREGNTLADKAALNILNFLKHPKKIVDFFPDGSDERQFCSPGFNMPIALVMRKMFGTFKEYHNSLDDEKFINFKTIIETLKIYYEILLTIENNFLPLGRVQYGTPQLSRSKIDLYPKQMDHQRNPKNSDVKLMMEILNLSDGKKDILDICNEKKYKLIDHINLYDKLLKSGYIKKHESTSNLRRPS